MLVDPRPYTYEYRKPRYSNPTFQSRNLYDSLYYRYPHEPANDYFNKVPSKYEERDRILRSSEVQDTRGLNRNYSEVKSKNHNFEDYHRNMMTDRNPEKYDSGYKLPAIGKNTQNKRIQPNIPKNIDAQMISKSELLTQRKQGFERFGIYERQQKPYNIISCYPKQEENNKLRNFPKLTLQNRLIENGSYHSFKGEKF